MSDPHAEGFRPSHFGALSACIHHRNKPGQSEAAERGTGIHNEIAILMESHPETPEIKWGQEAQWAGELALTYQDQGWRIFAVEVPVDILDENGQKITQGTIDLVLERNGEYLIIDWKTGDQGDYMPQMCAYVMAWMDLHPHAKVHGLIAYVDLRETRDHYLGDYYGSARLVLSIWDRWQNKEKEPYVINGFCDYCGLRGECPAWAREATAAFDKVNYLTLNPATGLPQGGNLAPAAVVGLKNDPERLDAFLTAWERAKTLVEEDWALKEALKTHMETGFKATNHSLVNIPTKLQLIKSIDPEEFLLGFVKEVGTAKSAPAIKVDAEKALSIWTGFDAHKPFPAKIKETFLERLGYSYVRAKGKPGAGDARKKRKELE